LHTGSARPQEEAERQGDEEPEGTARHGGLLRSWMCGGTNLATTSWLFGIFGENHAHVKDPEVVRGHTWMS
jgi:hypothetical protein